MTDATVPLTTPCTVCLRGTLGAVTLAAGIVVAPLAAPALPAPHRSDIRLTATDAPATATGGDIALILGPSLISTPTEQYAQTADALYLAPNGFTGQAEVLTTPESPYNLDASEDSGAKILTDKITALISSGQVDPEHPVTVFGYSQSAALTTLAMQQLHDAGVPSADVHFVLVGDPANPDGGLLVGFDDLPALVSHYQSEDITLGDPTPDDLYPTDIYTYEYDGYADFPRYPLDLLADLNASLGLVTQHMAYLGLTADQIATATVLDTSGEGLIHSHLIASEYLPLLVPLLLAPVIGKPLYDLIEPDARILVNLGYGSIDDGWNSGPADVPTSFSLGLPDLDWSAVDAALAKGAQAGWAAFTADVENPATYQFTSMVDNPALATLISAASGAGIIDTAHPESFGDVIGAFLHAISASLSGIGAVSPADAVASSAAAVGDLGTGNLLEETAALLGL